ncbi:cell wall hydrolase [Sphingobium lignivorans]|nr:cell wall hydrolase [Sphingobium lignivorans]
MPNTTVIAALTAFGLMSSTLALAEVTDTSPAVFEVPATVNAPAALPVPVEPDTSLSSDAGFSPLADPEQPDSLPELVAAVDERGALSEDEHCLATAIYYEARSESLSGQLAVANVVLQRAKSGRFPTSLCGVVTQPGQFSFVRSGRLPDAPETAPQWRTAKAIAEIAMEGSWENPVQGALFFHSTRVQPGWNRAKLTRIGGHVFYR